MSAGVRVVLALLLAAVLTYAQQAPSWSWQCSQQSLYINGTYLAVSLCPIPGTAIVANYMIGGYCVNSTAAVIEAWTVSGQPATLTVTLANYYNTSKSAAYTVTGNLTVKLWPPPNSTLPTAAYVIYSISGVNTAFVLNCGLPAAAAPPPNLKTALALVVPIAAAVAALRYSPKRTALAMAATPPAYWMVAQALGIAPPPNIMAVITSLYIVAAIFIWITTS